ncbi:hypothetical protein ACFQFQ_06040 [Sulfitobacter porphyrae]|uniref:Uncharacterized protein n=1 Tax=Sulfitobacter porphyrae TaxID=1246864 RepID=A0ABW2B0G6_9RHOB
MDDQIVGNQLIGAGRTGHESEAQKGPKARDGLWYEYLDWHLSFFL